jgi:cytochrome c553
VTRVLVLALALALGGAAQAAGNAAAGKEKAAQVCAACHGPSGAQPTAPENPILAGQHYDYLVRALRDYRSGKRNSAVMKGFAASLSLEDIEDLAAWFASQDSGLRYQR